MYKMELFFEIWLSGYMPIFTPLEANIKHTSIDYDKTKKTDDLLFDDVNAYEGLVEKLIYLFNIFLPVKILSQLMEQPKISHWP